MLKRSMVNGHTALSLENEHLQVGVLPEKGADIFELIYKSAERSDNIQFLMQTPWGLKPHGTQPPADFLENYEGGWQELFPNAGDGCQYRGQDIPFHGEVALLPWQFDVLQDDANETALHLSVNCPRTPFHLERIMRLRRNESRLLIQEKVTNIGDESYEFVWGHHITLGGNFLEDGCLLDTPAQQIFTPDVLYEPLTARLEAHQTGTWPLGRGRGGESVDLSFVAGPQAHSHDDVILGGLKRGVYRVANPRLKLTFILEWDADVFPWLILWQPYGGADLPPLTGIYGVGLEPWASRYPLAEAVKEGQAKILQGSQSLATELVVEIQPA
jgi:galactose mutarotase-like enzyme